MSIKIAGSITGNIAEVNSDNEQLMAPTSNPDKSGYIALAGEINDGSITGTREVLKIGVSDEGRMEVGLDSLMFNDSFNYTAQNTANYRHPVTTQTVTYVNGYVILNGSSITTINTNSAVQTYKPFPVFGGFGLQVSISALFTVAPQTNAVTEWGLFTATLPGAAIPTDGTYFRLTSSGTFKCIINYNGTETQSADLTIPSSGVNHQYEIFLNEQTVIFKVDGIVYYDVDTPAGQGQPFMQGSLPISFRHYIAGSAPALAMQFKVSDIDVNLGDMNTTKLWENVMAGMGLMAYQGQNGGTMGSSALYTNSLAPGAGAAMTNTTAALGSGLGGQFSILPTLTANTDGILCSFQNPVGSTTQTARTLYIEGIRIQGIVTTVLVGGPVYYFYSLAFGSTAVSLATAESATAKAPRRIALGMESYAVTAAVGALGSSGVAMQFNSPIAVYPGEFVQLIAKNVGTVTTTGVITVLVTLDAHFE